MERDSDEHYDTQQLAVELNLNQQQTPHKTHIALYTNEIQLSPLYYEFESWKFFFILLLHLSTVGQQFFLIIPNVL
jgi:hypothetical protein